MRLTYLYISFSTLLVFTLKYNSFSQCNLYVPQHTYYVCAGNYVQLQSSLDCSIVLDSNNFNTGSLGTGWSSTSGPMFTNPCGPGPDGSTYLWIGPASSFPREVISPSLTINDSSTICFDMMYASQANSNPCEGPDEPTEGVHLQFSNIGPSGPWNDISYWDPAGGYDPTLTTWNNYCQTFYYNGIIWFRWFQTNTSGNDYDHWGLDNIFITVQDPNLIDSVYWNNQNGTFYVGSTPPAFIPDSSMWVTINHDNGTSIYTDTIWINVFQAASVSFTGLQDTVCNNDPSLPLTGTPAGGIFVGNGMSDSTFNPSLGLIGLNIIQYFYYTITTDTMDGNVPVFSDDFSTDKGWTGYGLGGWERGSATASTGCSGNQDPSTDHTLTGDNYIIGNYLGACYPNSMISTYWLTSPVINCSDFNSCKLDFYSFSGCESPSWDHLYIEASNDLGNTWLSVYSNAASVSENEWTYRTYSIPQADGSSGFQFRFGMGITDASVTYSGWNIDDVSVICYGTGVFADTICLNAFSDSVYVENCASVTEITHGNSILSIIPNPATESSVKAEWNIENSDQCTKLEVYNHRGQLVYQSEIKEKQNSRDISLKSFNNGLYEASLIGCKGIIARNRFIVNK